jgi:hypothetical protein
MTVECHQCEACTDAVLKQDENAKRSVHRNWCTCMQCVDNSRKHRHWSLNAAFDTHRLLITKLKERRRPAYAKPNTRQRRTQHLWNKGPFKATVGTRAERIPIVRVYSRVSRPLPFYTDSIVVQTIRDRIHQQLAIELHLRAGLEHRLPRDTHTRIYHSDDDDDNNNNNNDSAPATTWIIQVQQHYHVHIAR